MNLHLAALKCRYSGGRSPNGPNPSCHALHLGCRGLILHQCLSPQATASPPLFSSVLMINLLIALGWVLDASPHPELCWRGWECPWLRSLTLSYSSLRTLLPGAACSSANTPAPALLAGVGWHPQFLGPILHGSAEG